MWYVIGTHSNTIFQIIVHLRSVTVLMTCDVYTIIFYVVPFFKNLFFAVLLLRILRQKAETRDHHDLVSSMVVGTAIASFLGGEPLAINANRFNPWCYNQSLIVM